ncbi:MAG: hypothetical protein GX299_03110 [Epulopiscium sp.]|nr:hypothetical protein [Candidatus Epulonipiscium sp.]
MKRKCNLNRCKRNISCIQKKTLGLVLFSVGSGMLVVIIIPWWGFLAAIILLATGAYLLFSDCC